MFFWNSLAISMIQQMLAVWSLVHLPFLNPTWTPGSSWLTYCWSLSWRILSITLLACEMQLCSSLSILPDVQAGFRKGRGTRDQTNIRWIIEKAREFQKNIYFSFIDYAKASDCGDHNKLWKILKEMGIPDHVACLLRNLYAGQEAIIRTGCGTTDWF